MHHHTKIVLGADPSGVTMQNLSNRAVALDLIQWAARPGYIVQYPIDQGEQISFAVRCQQADVVAKAVLETYIACKSIRKRSGTGPQTGCNEWTATYCQADM